MFRLIGLVASIGLADSMNPSTIAPGLYLASAAQPRRRLLEFTVGVFAVYFIGGAVLVFGPGQLLLSLVPRPTPTVRYILELVAGVVMLGAGVVLWLRRGQLARHRLPSPRVGGKSSLLLGATITVVELPTAFPYFAAIAAIVGSGSGPVGRLTALVIFNVCFVAPLLLILLTLVVAGDGAQRILNTAREFLQRRWPVLLAALALLAGAFVAVLGATGLAGMGHGRIAGIARRFRHAITH